MKIELIRNARPQGHWMSVESMIADLQSEAVVLEPGDKIFVTAEDSKLIPIRNRNRFRLVESKSHAVER